MSRLNLPLLISLLAVFSCSRPMPIDSTSPVKTDEISELIATGAYPDYYYNLANELAAAGRIEQAIEAYQNCIAQSASQTFVEDAIFNLSNLYFEHQQDSMGLVLMDSLIARKYTWLAWYREAPEELASSPAYASRLHQIDSLEQMKANPENCTFHYEDVTNFIQAFKKAQSNWSEAPRFFYEDYFAKASKALFLYQKYKIQSSAHLFAYRVEDRQKYFSSIVPNLEKISSYENELREYLARFKELYPAAVFPDIYFTVGCFNAGGTSSPFGLIIGAEMHSMNEDSDLSNFSSWEKSVVRGFDNLPLITLHELVHIQQNDNYDNLLGNAIYEGAADFISEKICGSHINKHVHEWANERELEIWKAFTADMFSDDASDWIGNADNAVDKPADLGYYVGYKICESYFNKVEDKTQAIADIISISNWMDFWLASGYMVEKVD